MSESKPGLWERVAAHPWLAALAAFVLLYCPLLRYAFSTLDFSAEADAQSRIAQIMNRPPAPPPPLPVLKSFARRDLVLQRDPLQALDQNLPRPKPGSAASDTADSFRFVTSYRNENRPCVVSRDSANRLARFCVGDKIADGTIKRVDARRVIIEAAGTQRVEEIAPEKKSAAP